MEGDWREHGTVVEGNMVPPTVPPAEDDVSRGMFMGFNPFLEESDKTACRERVYRRASASVVTACARGSTDVGRCKIIPGETAVVVVVVW